MLSPNPSVAGEFRELPDTARERAGRLLWDRLLQPIDADPNARDDERPDDEDDDAA
jgi:hypothetical protein